MIRAECSLSLDTSKFAADAIAENSGQNSVHQDIEMVDADFHPSNKRRHTDDLYAQPTKARKLTDQDRLFHGEDHGAPNALPNLQPLHRDSGIGLEEEDRTHSMKVSILRSRLSEELSIVPKAKLVSILENLCDRNEMMVEYFAKELLDERLQQTALGNAVTQLLSASTAEQNSSRKPTRKSYPAASTENARHKSSRLKGRMSFPSLDVPEEEEIANLGHAETSGPVSGSHKCLRCSSICDLDGVRSTTECHYHDGMYSIS